MKMLAGMRLSTWQRIRNGIEKLVEIGFGRADGWRQTSFGFAAKQLDLA